MRVGGARWYEPVDPPADLIGLLACAWTAKPTGRHRLTPDACIDLLWLSSGGLILCGPERTAWEFELPSDVVAVGVRFRPGVAPTLLGFDASEVGDRLVPLAGFVGDAAASELDDRIRACSTLAGSRDELVAWVLARFGQYANEPFAEAVLAHLEAEPQASQGEIASIVGLSVRQTHRRSLRAFGYGTATLARLLRFQRFLAMAQQDDGTTSVGVLGARAGYADQSHLTRDCRAITGLGVSAFLADYFPTFPDMSDMYKTATSSVARIMR